MQEVHAKLIRGRRRRVLAFAQIDEAAADGAYVPPQDRSRRITSLDPADGSPSASLRLIVSASSSRTSA